MSKRRLGATPRPTSATPSPRKRTKIKSNQASIDSFFHTVPRDDEVASTECSHQGTTAIPTHRLDQSSAVFATIISSGRLKTPDGPPPPSQTDKGVLLGPGGGAYQDASPLAVSERVAIIDVDNLSSAELRSTPADRERQDNEDLSDSPCKNVRLGPSSRSIPGPAFIGNAAPAGVEVYKSLAVDPSLYRLDTVPWCKGTHAPYSFLAFALCTLSGTKSRIAILNTLTNLLRALVRFHPPSLLPALYLLSNSLSPPYVPLELGLGPSIINKAIQHTSGLTPLALKQLYNSTGDPGDAAFEAKSKVQTLLPHAPLLITGVYDSLLQIAHVKGQGSSKRKQVIIERLLVAAKGEEVRYLVRTLYQNLRVGAVRTSILAALARAVIVTPPAVSVGSAELLTFASPLPANSEKKPADGHKDSLPKLYARAEALVKKAYVQRPSFDHIVQELLRPEGGLDGLVERLSLIVGIPLLPALGSPVRSFTEVYERLGSSPFSAEFKYDGQRAQIHAARTEGSVVSVGLFSRHLEDMTEKYPDVVSLVECIFARTPQLSSFILDTEIVAVDSGDGSLRSFQELSNRARREVNIDDIKVSVCVFAFDIMYLDGRVLLQEPFRERRYLLHSFFPPLKPQIPGAARFDHVQHCESEDGAEALEEFWQLALASRAEGLMIKLLESEDSAGDLEPVQSKMRKKPLPATYEPDKRTSAWLKLKKDYVTGLADSLDLVPVGAWHGNGRKANWWSPVLLAVWDPEADKLVAVCKCMSGFTDAFYKGLRERHPENTDSCSPVPQQWTYACEYGGFKPDVYFKPREVWEIRGADITISPVSAAAMGKVSTSRGLSLRFPRFVKIREDKAIEDASTSSYLAKMWRDQENRSKVDEVDDDDVVEILDATEDCGSE